MKIAYLSSLAHPDLCTYLENAGHVIQTFPELRTVSSLVANHPRADTAVQARSQSLNLLSMKVPPKRS